MYVNDMFRLAMREAPELRTVNTKKGEVSVLNLTVVPNYTPEDKVTPWIKVTLWASQAEGYAPIIAQAMADGTKLKANISGTLQFSSYQIDAFDANGDPKTIVKMSPEITSLNGFRLINEIYPARDNEAQSSAASDIVAAASSKADTDDIPF